MEMKKKQTDGLSCQIEIMDSILNNMNITIYVSDMTTHKILFANATLKQRYENVPLEGEICWEALKHEIKRCENCPIPYLLKNPGKSYQWKFSEDEDSFQVYDVIIPWSKGRLVHLQYMVKIMA